MSQRDVLYTRKVARARVDVEHVIKRIKEFHLFDRLSPLTMIDIADEIVIACSLLPNFRGSMIKNKELI